MLHICKIGCWMLWCLQLLPLEAHTSDCWLSVRCGIHTYICATFVFRRGKRCVQRISIKHQALSMHISKYIQRSIYLHCCCNIIIICNNSPLVPWRMRLRLQQNALPRSTGGCTQHARMRHELMGRLGSARQTCVLIWILNDMLICSRLWKKKSFCEFICNRRACIQICSWSNSWFYLILFLLFSCNNTTDKRYTMHRCGLCSLRSI